MPASSLRQGRAGQDRKWGVCPPQGKAANGKHLMCSTPYTLQVWDNERVVIIPDHYIFTADARANRNVDILR